MGFFLTNSRSDFHPRAAIQGPPRPAVAISGFRFYEPELGRWLSRDPIEEEGGENLYASTDNNMVGGVDPFGLLGVAPPPEDKAPPCPYTCAQIKKWMNAFSFGYSDTLWKYWKAGSGKPLDLPFDAFDRDGFERKRVLEPLVAWGENQAKGLACNQSGHKLVSLAKPKKTNKYATGVSRKMIYGYRFWYTCSVYYSRRCQSGYCGCSTEAFVSCTFNASDDVDFWRDDDTGSSSFVIPGGKRIYDEWVLDCFPKGKGFTVSARTTETQEHRTCE
jgi:hypothetical protein